MPADGTVRRWLPKTWQHAEPLPWPIALSLIHIYNDLNAEIAAELLQEEGCTVDRAKDGVECVDMLEKACLLYTSYIKYFVFPKDML